MALLQIQVEEALKKSIQAKAKFYGVSTSALLKIHLTQHFLENENFVAGNVFNAPRDNRGKGVLLEDFLALNPDA